MENQNKLDALEVRISQLEDLLAELSNENTTGQDVKELVEEDTATSSNVTEDLVDETINTTSAITEEAMTTLLETLREEMTETTKKNQLSTIRWIVATAASTVTAIAGIIKVFM